MLLFDFLLLHHALRPKARSAVKYGRGISVELTYQRLYLFCFFIGSVGRYAMLPDHFETNFAAAKLKLSYV